MSLLNHSGWGFEKSIFVNFTFHNVSIKSIPADLLYRDPQHFTFHNVSIKSTCMTPVYCFKIIFTFHNVSIKSQSISDNAVIILYFTFHNVSIKSRILRNKANHTRGTLHSTMSLLNLDMAKVESYHNVVFTFHNVSIKSKYVVSAVFVQPPLHSTMSLLNLVAYLIHKSCFLVLYIPQCLY